MVDSGAFRVQYGPQSGARGPSLGRWMLMVTGVLLGALALHFALYLATTPPPAGATALEGYGRWWNAFLMGQPLTGEPLPLTGPEPVVAQAPVDPPETTPVADPWAMAEETSLRRYFPLGPNHAWYYRVTHEQVGNAEPSEARIVKVAVVAVDRSRETPRYRVAVDGVEVDYWFAGEQLLMERGSGAARVRRVVLQEPLEPGTEWASPDEKLHVAIEGTKSLALEFARVDALRVSVFEEATGTQTQLYYAPDLGLVRQEEKRGVGNELAWELIGFSADGRSVGQVSEVTPAS